MSHSWSTVYNESYYCTTKAKKNFGGLYVPFDTETVLVDATTFTELT